jgi:hypothetical protein
VCRFLSVTYYDGSQQSLVGDVLRTGVPEIGFSEYPDDGPSQLNVEFNAETLARIARECPEARSGPEAVRMLVAQSLQHREQTLTPGEIERAHRDAVADIRCDISEMRALLQTAVAEK